MSSEPDGAFVRRGTYHTSMSTVGWQTTAGPGRIDIDAPWFRCSHKLAVVHLGQSAVVLRTAGGGRLLVVTDSSAGLMPDGICIDDAAFPAVRDALKRKTAHGREVTSDQLVSPALARTSLRLDPTHPDPEAIDALRLHAARSEHRPAVGMRWGMDPAPIRARSGALASAAVGGRAREVGAMLGTLIGAGPGTTPSGDDVIVGVLAGFVLTRQGRAATTICSALIPLLPRTTLASRHYLTAATQGRFGEHIHDLALAVAGHTPTELAVDRARTWGSCSGLDVLSGLLAAAVTGFLTEERMEAIA